MSKIYNGLNNNFTLISNEILVDSRLSAMAFKIYSYICYRLGNNAEWEFYTNEIIHHFKEGKYAFKTARDELIEYGYLEIVKQNKTAEGKFAGNDYIIHNKPICKNPSQVKPISDEPLTDKPITNNIYINKTDINNNYKKEKSKKEKTFIECKNNQIKECLQELNNESTFTSQEIDKLAEFINDRVYTEINGNKRKRNVKNSITSIKIQFNQAKAIKNACSISMVELFEKDNENLYNFKFLYNSSGGLIDGLKPWVMDAITKHHKQPKQYNKFTIPVEEFFVEREKNDINF